MFILLVVRSNNTDAAPNHAHNIADSSIFLDSVRLVDAIGVSRSSRTVRRVCFWFRLRFVFFFFFFRVVIVTHAILLSLIDREFRVAKRVRQYIFVRSFYPSG